MVDKSKRCNNVVLYVLSLKLLWEASFSAGRQRNDEKMTVGQITGFKSCPSNSVVFFVPETSRWHIAAWCAAFFGNAALRSFLRSADGVCRFRAASSLWLYGSDLVGRKAGFGKSSVSQRIDAV